jgi:hypothetical protein
VPKRFLIAAPALTGRARQDVVRVGLFRSPLEHSRQSRIHRNVARFTILRIPDSQDSCHKVDVRMSEVEDLAQSYAGVQRDRDNPAHGINAAAGEQSSSLDSLQSRSDCGLPKFRPLRD